MSPASLDVNRKRKRGSIIKRNVYGNGTFFQAKEKVLFKQFYHINF